MRSRSLGPGFGLLLAVLCLLSVLCLALGCQRGAPEGSGREGGQGGGHAPEAGAGLPQGGQAAPNDSLPETKEGTIPLEGFQEPFTFRLFSVAGQGLAVPFHTYVPNDVLAEVIESAKPQEGRGPAGVDAVRFVANFEGQRTEDCFLAVRFLDDGTTEDQARQELERSAQEGRTERAEGVPPRFPGSIDEADYAREKDGGPEWLQGTVALGRRGPRYYLLTLQVPETYEEGFVPRALSILEEWRWEDGEPPSSGPIPLRPE